MMAPQYIIEVNETNFEFEVVQFSLNTPVVVDFWADWCRPCVPLAKQLHMLANEGQGNFRLARVNVDQNPNLALQFGVRTLPTVKAFSGGHIVAEFVGPQPEDRIRDFIRQLQPPSPAALLVEKGNGLMAMENWEAAANAFDDALDITPEYPAALYGLVRAMIALGHGYEAVETISAFPPSRYYLPAQELLPVAEAVTKLESVDLDGDLSPQQALYWRAIRLVATGKIQLAVDGLLAALRDDRNNKELRKLILAVLEVMGEQNPATADYRKEFALIVF